MDFESYLVNARLRVFDPIDQEGLLPLERYTPESSQLQIVNSYQVERFIFCHVCGKSIHKSGYTCLDGADNLVLMGSCCIKKYFSPELITVAQKNFQKRTDVAWNNYNISQFRSISTVVDQWIVRNRPLLNSIQDAWDVIKNRRSSEIADALKSIQRDNGRLVERREVGQIATSTNGGRAFIETEILCAFRHYEGISRIDSMRTSIADILQFCSEIESVKPDSSDGFIEKIVKRYDRFFLPAVGILDSIVCFSCEFFSEDNLDLVCASLDRKRNQKLSNLQTYKSRKLLDVVRKEIGYGYEMPKPTLSEVVGENTNLLSDIRSRASKTQVE